MNSYQPMNLSQVDPVNELATFLRKHGTDIEDKTNKFSLSSSSLVYYNKCFRHLSHQTTGASSAGGAQSKREQDATYLLNFFRRMHAVKLVHGTLTLQGAVDIGPFHALTFLEIKRVPFHLLVGLSALRRQLEVLICSRSLGSISTLLHSCGGDMSSGAPWPSLHTVNLSHNHIEKLDDSLKLLPSVKVLDLSHNNIKHTRSYLEDLSEIAHLNLGFNQMETLPALGLVARTNLKSLSLKNNNLESLAGLEDYSSLEVLDVATNCIFDRMELRMLGYLHSIRAVYLHGNPVTYDPDYRLQIVKKLPHQSKRYKTKVDGKALTPSEAELVCAESFTPSPVSRRPSPRNPANDFENSLNVNADISSFEDSMDLSSTRPLIRKEKKSRGKRNLRKVKHAAIADPTKAHLESNTSITTTSDSDIEGTKQKVEQMRKNHGSDWLLALQDPYSTPAVTSGQSSVTSTSNMERPTTIEVEVEHHNVERKSVEREMIVVEKSTEEVKPHNMPEAGDTVQTVEIDSRTSQTNQSSVKENDSRTSLSQSDQNDLKEADSKMAVNTDSKVAAKTDLKMAANETDLNAAQQQSVKEIDSGINIYQTDEHPVKEIDSGTNIYQVKSSESEDRINGVQQGDTSTDEPQELLSPLLVTVYSKNDTDQVQLFVTVRPTYIEEKDISGQVTEELDLVSLKGMKKSQDTLRDSDSQFVIVPVVELTFDYIRRDRQKRRYFMENEESCLALVNVLEPFVEKRQAEARRKGMVQCLKCSTEFYKGEAKRKVHKKQRKSVISNGGESQDNSSSDIESMNEILVCPECNSGMIVDLERPQLGDGLASNVSTPMGSLSSLEMSAKPIAASSPWKPLDSTKSSPSTDYHSAEGSPSSSPQQPSYLTAKSETSTVTPDTRITNSTGSTLAISVTDSEQSSLARRSLLGDFKLPDPSLRYSIGESADGEISPYPAEKLSQVLYSGVKGFDQKYSLVPQDILSGNSSTETSRPSTPRSKHSNTGASGGRSRTMSVNSNDENQQPSVAESKERMMAGKPPQFPGHSSSNRQSNDGNSWLSTRNRKPSGTGSEDDIEILDKHSSHQIHVSVEESLKQLLKSRTDDASNRLDSNDSDIAVIGDQTDYPKVDGATTDTVFDPGNEAHNLASALSDAASRMLPLSPVAELTSNVSCLETSSGSDNDIHIHADYPATQTSTKDSSVPQVQVKNGDLPLEHSSTESQMSDSIYSKSRRRGSSTAENVTIDFSQVDHRLKLHFDMELFGDDEEFGCMIKANIYQLSKAAEFKGILLVSTNNLYILKITKEESDTPSDWLIKRTQHSIRDLTYIHVGLGSQSFQLEFNNDGILYTVAIRDKLWCEKFISQLTDVVHNSPTNKRKYKGIVRDHPNTLANLLCQVFGALLSENSSPDVDTNLTLYILGYRKVIKELKKKHGKGVKDAGVSLQLEPIGLAVTAEDVYLIGENHFWPLQQSKVGRGSSRGQGSHQFKHLDQHVFTDITGLELYEDALCDVTINFHSEDTGDESQWHIQTETSSSLGAFMSAIQQPWQQLFGVAMPQIMHPTITIQDEF